VKIDATTSRTTASGCSGATADYLPRNTIEPQTTPQALHTPAFISPTMKYLASVWFVPDRRRLERRSKNLWSAP
jgi:hypothetical protein